MRRMKAILVNMDGACCSSLITNVTMWLMCELHQSQPQAWGQIVT